MKVLNRTRLIHEVSWELTMSSQVVSKSLITAFWLYFFKAFISKCVVFFLDSIILFAFGGTVCNHIKALLTVNVDHLYSSHLANYAVKMENRLFDIYYLLQSNGYWLLLGTLLSSWMLVYWLIFFFQDLSVYWALVWFVHNSFSWSCLLLKGSVLCLPFCNVLGCHLSSTSPRREWLIIQRWLHLCRANFIRPFWLDYI